MGALFQAVEVRAVVSFDTIAYGAQTTSPRRLLLHAHRQRQHELELH